MLHRLYRAFLKRATEHADSILITAIRRLISLFVVLLKRWHRFDFPEREVGGWWWVDRFRFEILLRWFEYESVRVVRKIAKPGAMAIDIGAHIGYYTRLLSELVGPRGRVFAFEPDPRNFAVLQRNLSRRNYRNVELFNMAVGDVNGEVPLYLSEGHSNHSLIEGFVKSEAEIQVEIVTLDAFLEQRGIDQIDFLKSDTEGAEPRVLSGMQRTIARSSQLDMLMELNPDALASAGVDPHEFIERIRQMGFSIDAVNPDRETQAIYHNILCHKIPHAP
jgi:FkbM family methyltransferase